MQDASLSTTDCSPLAPSFAGRPQDAYSVFDGWELYPSNLPDFDTLCDDSKGYSNRLDSLSSYLFSNKIALHVIDAYGGCSPLGRILWTQQRLTCTSNADFTAFTAAKNRFLADSTPLRSLRDAENYFQSPIPDLRIM